MPLLANLSVACTLLAALWMIGDFVTPDMVSSGAPDGSTDVLATFGVDAMLDDGKPALGIAAIAVGPAAADPTRGGTDAYAANARGGPLRAQRSDPAARSVRDQAGGCDGSWSRRGRSMLGAVLLIWWLLPIYNMVMIALDSQGTTEFAGYIIPPDPSLEAFGAVLFQGYWYLADFWHQFGNSLYVGLTTMVLNVAIGSAASFALARMRPSVAAGCRRTRRCSLCRPGVFLVIPFDRLMHSYGLMDNLWSVIAVDVVFVCRARC